MKLSLPGVRKLILGLGMSLLLGMGALSLLGISPAFIYYGPGVATGIGSKLLCSAEYVIGNSREQAFDDLVQYSPILAQISFHYDEAQQTVSTSLFGLQPKTASYIPGLGCAVNYDGFQQRQQLELQQTGQNSAPWPAGNTVSTIDNSIQSLTDELLANDNDNGLNTRALLVVKDGRIVAESYGQEMNADSRLLGWSMAKSLNAIMLGNLEMRGLLDLTATTGFPEWQDDERARIRIEDLLTMTDGLEFSEEYNPGDDATAMLFTSASASGYVLQKPIAATPGTRFNYSSGTANILSRLYTSTLGSPQAAYDNFMDSIYRPMAFQHAVFETDASGIFMGSSYFYASARDWARVGQLMLDRGVLNSQRLVTEDWVDRATTPNSSSNDKAYGYQWWLNRGNEDLRYDSLPADAFYANGNRQQFLMIFPSHNAVIVRLGWTEDRYPVAANFGRILNAL